MRRIACLYFMTLGLFAYSQKVLVTETEEKADEIKRKGLSIMMQLDEEFVKKQWQKKLRELGSLKTRSGAIIIDQANMPGISANPVKIVSKVQNNGQGTKVWYSIELGESQFVTSSEGLKYNEASKFIHDFGVATYIMDINEQIKEAEKILAVQVKEQDKILLKGDNIRNSIYKSKNDKAILLQKIHAIDSTYLILKSDSLQNALNQKASAENVNKMKHAVDLVKDKITNVE